MEQHERLVTPSPSTESDHRRQVEELEAALVDVSMSDRVELVARPLGHGSYRISSVEGTVEFDRVDDGTHPDYRVRSVSGRNPVEDQNPGHLVGHATERDMVHPDRRNNTYPHAYDSVAQFFDSPSAPDLIATHTAAHFTDGHLGQHGSLGVVQARAPFIAAGAGVRKLGLVDRSTRTVNIAPTIASLLGFTPHPDGVGPTGARRPDALLRRQDGDTESFALDGSTADHVVVVLMDGCNANLLHEAAASGAAPNVASLIGGGVGYRHGSIASLPTATLANHTTAATGAHPGHSGVLHNAWVDRAEGTSPDLLAMDQMFWAMRHLSEEVESVFAALKRNRPDAFSTATFEFCDTGATFSSFAMVRDRAGAALPELDEVDGADPDAVATSAAYGFMSRVDHLSVTQTIECWEQAHGNPLPTLSWCGLAVTDEAGHESGPHGELALAAVRDSDARLGRLLDAIDRAGVRERTAVLVIADHGMEQTNPEVDRDWAEDLAGAGVPYREVGGGLFYVGAA